ncbi:MAG: hypothetical protein ACI9Y1_002576 [Lentisphaeria bacterium]|jgi:hypothetical protein
MSYLKADVLEREGPNGETFSGDSDLMLADFIWKWSPNGNAKNTNLSLQAEFFQRTERGELNTIEHQSTTITSHKSGWYAQAVYQFNPQWRIGLRYDSLLADDLAEIVNSNDGEVSLANYSGSVFDNSNHSPRQTSVMIDWNNSEFSRLRLQYSRDRSSLQTANLWTLQYTAAFGAHGAHSF